MFSRKFVNDHKGSRQSHHAVSFTSSLSRKEVIKLLIKMGVAKFITEDNTPKEMDLYNPNFTRYNDNRIAGAPQYHVSSQCCAFTKNSQRWFLFPIHEKDLENTGFDGEDLVKWIMFLNGMKAGFEFHYLGVQEGNTYTHKNMYRGWGKDRNSFHWVLVPANPTGVHYKKTYLHWIFLRYLINTTASEAHMLDIKAKRLAYYNIPRITMMLHEDFGVPKLKALMYAHLAYPFYYYYGFIASDCFNTDDNPIKADVSVTAEEFKHLLSNDSITGANNMLAISQNASPTVRSYRKRDYAAPYKPSVLWALFEKGDYEGFIKHIKDSYKSIAPKKTIRTYVKKKSVSK
jgi:hypothetical protein